MSPSVPLKVIPPPNLTNDSPILVAPQGVSSQSAQRWMMFVKWIHNKCENNNNKYFKIVKIITVGG